MTQHTIDSLFARVRQLIAVLPTNEATAVAQLFFDYSQHHSSLVNDLATMLETTTHKLNQMNELNAQQECELRMWRQAEADWWQSRVSRETALFEDRLEMRQPVLGEEMMERLVEGRR